MAVTSRKHVRVGDIREALHTRSIFYNLFIFELTKRREHKTEGFVTQNNIREIKELFYEY